jgi:hypothetical protein
MIDGYEINFSQLQNELKSLTPYNMTFHVLQTGGTRERLEKGA